MLIDINSTQVLNSKDLYKQGDLVSINSNPGLSMTVINVGSDALKCIFIDKKHKVNTLNIPKDCVQFFDEHVTEPVLTKIPLLYSKEKDTYSFIEYASLFGQKVNPNTPTDEKIVSDARLVYNFKKYYPRNKQDVFTRISMAKNYFNCDQIVAIPGHLPELNSLQKTFGKTIERISEIEERKYNHNKELPAGYPKSYIIDWNKINGKILLVDDILTSGRTMSHFREVFKKNGFEVISLSLGIDHKIDTQIVHYFWLFTH